MDQIEIRPRPHLGEHAFAVWRVNGVMPEYVVDASQAGSRHVDFVIHRVGAEADDWTEETPTYETCQWLKGRVKWDRCSDWDLGGLHACTREDLVILGETMAACWDAASRILSATWSAE